jgi:hypothetical protein
MGRRALAASLIGDAAVKNNYDLALLVRFAGHGSAGC